MTTKQSIAEIGALTELDKQLRCRERLEEFHAENGDWKAVMSDKWAMVRLVERGV